MGKNINKLIIVESPSKTKTLQKFLGDDYTIKASVGHIRDLPDKELGVDVDNNFKPKYVVSSGKQKVITELKSALKNADELYLATDPDREGEAISWHLIELLKPKIPIKRLAFHEITKSAIQDAFSHTRDIDRSLVNAQETRRILDRLFGFLVSKQLWLNVKGGLSAGRVQSPALKLIVNKEKQRSAFRQGEYWNLTGTFEAEKGKFDARLTLLDNNKIASGKDFDKNTGEVSKKNITVLNKEKTESLSKQLKENSWIIDSIEQKPITSNPYPPFITSTLQQEGIRKLRMSSQQVMMSAQKLYENGYITYMRTDSISLSAEAINGARNAIQKLYGSDYLPSKPRAFKSKVKNAQEAHEAIRPAGATFRTPESLSGKLSGKEWQLYDLIWKRTVASQMVSAKLLQTTIKVSDGNAIFEAKGKVIEFPGYFKAYVQGSDDPSGELDNKEKTLPSLSKGENVHCEQLLPSQHFTKPPPRFTEATLVKELEALGIGRPSTYATIMTNIQKRGYVNRVKGSLIPTLTAYAIVHFLEKYFDDLIDLQFTAKLEDLLDEISRKELSHSDFLNGFYFGNDKHDGLKNQIEQEFDKAVSKTILTLEENSENPIAIKIGRYGIYLQKNGENATLPDDAIPSELNPEIIQTYFDKKNESPEELGLSENNETIFLKEGRYGPYLQSGKKMKSLPHGFSKNEITPNIAKKIIALPSELGKHPDNNETITADIGRYGPYIRCGKETRKVMAPDIIIDLTLERAIEILATSKKSSAPAVLKELGTDPDTKNTIELKDGRYGVYVSDGKINATLPKGTDQNTLTLETAIELIKEKKAKGPKKRRFKKRK